MPKPFHGGRSWPRTSFIHDRPIETLPPPDELCIPLWRGGSAIVVPGQHVAAQSVVGSLCTGMPAYTPLAGTVKEVFDFAELSVRPARFDHPRLTVRIAVSDDGTEPEPPFPPRPRYWELSHAELCHRLFAAGVADLRDRELPREIAFDALDPEPPLSTNLRLLMERPEELLEGMRVLMQAHAAVRARLAVPADRRELIAALRAMLTSSVNLHVAAVANRYPARHPALLPARCGLAAGAAIYAMRDALRARRAVALGRPVVTTFATLWDERARRFRNAELPLGTSLGRALGVAAPPDDHSLVAGGMLSGAAVHSANLPAGPQLDGALLLDAAAAKPRAACDGCGRCLAVCPARLDPSRIYRLERDGDRGGLQGLRTGDCLGCGLCTHACPAGLDLCQQVALAGGAVAEADRC